MSKKHKACLKLVEMSYFMKNYTRLLNGTTASYNDKTKIKDVNNAAKADAPISATKYINSEVSENNDNNKNTCTA